MQPEVLLSLLHDLQERHVAMRGERDAYKEAFEQLQAQLESVDETEPEAPES